MYVISFDSISYIDKISQDFIYDILPWYKLFITKDDNVTKVIVVDVGSS